MAKKTPTASIGNRPFDVIVDVESTGHTVKSAAHGRAACVETRLMVKVARLLELPDNARTHDAAQIEELVRSFQRFGQQHPIVINRSGIVVAGSGRLAAFKRMSPDANIWVTVCELDDAQARAFAITDNRTHDLSEFDDELLAANLRALAGELGIAADALDVPGFTAAEMAELLPLPDDREASATAAAAKVAGVVEDGAPPVPEHPTSTRGDVWLLGRHRLMCGDSASSAFEKMLLAWFTNASRALISGRGFYIWGGYANVANYPPALVASGLYFSQAIIWVKEHPVLTRKDFMGNHEWCFYGWKEGKGHKWFGPQNASDTWSIKKVSPSAMVHLTEKPVELAARALQYSSVPGERVLDLFGGSGSTLMACEQLDRVGFSMEIDPPYCDVIVDRWQRFTGQDATLEKGGATFDETREQCARVRASMTMTDRLEQVGSGGLRKRKAKATST